MNPEIFREFSVRAIADQELTDNVVVVIGQAIGTFFKQRSEGSAIVGRDVRKSSVRISQALIEGLVQSGIKVTDIGQVPTPVLNFAVDAQDADGGIMITASHNPPEYNGFKIRMEHTLHGDELQEICDIALEENFGQAISSGMLHNVKRLDPLPTYLDRIKTLAYKSIPLKIVVDGGNGTNGFIASGLLRNLGYEVVELYCEPDGDFPNRSPDPTKSDALTDLAGLVQTEKADLGLAYDGDGDRLVLMDEQGNVVPGDKVIMILARDVLKRESAKIVYEILCTQALADDVIAHGGEPIMTPSGYAYVHRAMHETGATLGGEFSGHLFFNEPDFRFDDAILGTVKLLNVLADRQRPVSDLTAELPSYFSSPQVRVPCPDAVKGAVIERIKAYFERNSYEITAIDGARINFEGGWALVRQSNTQPIISMRFEGRNPEQLTEIETQVRSLVDAEISDLTGEKLG